MSFFKSNLEGGAKYTSSKDEVILEMNAAIEYEAGNIEKSIDLFTDGISAYPNNPYFYYLRGNAKEDLRLWNEAIEDFTNYLKLTNGLFNGYFRLGLCFQNLKNYDEAIANYNKAIEKYNLTLPVIEEVALTIGKSGRRNYYNIPHESLYNNRAIVKTLIDDTAGAIEDCNIAIRINPEYANPYFIRGLEYLKAGDKIKARKDLTKADELGNPQAKTVIKQFLDDESENTNDDFYSKVIEFAEGSQSKEMSGGIRFRDGFLNNIKTNLEKNGQISSISNQILIHEAVDFLINMWQQYIQHKGSIDDFTKAFIAYETSLTFSSLRPDLNQTDFWKLTLKESLKEFNKI